jgi:protein TonB
MVELQPVPDLPSEKPPDEITVEQPPDEALTLVPIPLAKQPEKVEDTPPPAPRAAGQGRRPGGRSLMAGKSRAAIAALQALPARSPIAPRAGRRTFRLHRRSQRPPHNIARSSGYADLDDEVMAMIVRAQPLPPFPASMTQPRIDLTVPIRFSLR